MSSTFNVYYMRSEIYEQIIKEFVNISINDAFVILMLHIII